MSDIKCRGLKGDRYCDADLVTDEQVTIRLCDPHLAEHRRLAAAETEKVVPCVKRRSPGLSLVRPKTRLRLVLIEEGRGETWMSSPNWEITPDIDTFVGDYNKLVIHIRDRARKDRENWDAENDRIIRDGS